MVKFLRSSVHTGEISGYPGEGTRVTESQDPNFEGAPLKLMHLHETYKKLRWDVNRSKEIYYFVALFQK